MTEIHMPQEIIPLGRGFNVLVRTAIDAALRPLAIASALGDIIRRGEPFEFGDTDGLMDDSHPHYVDRQDLSIFG